VTILTALTRKPLPDRIWITGVVRIPSTPFRLDLYRFGSDPAGLGVHLVEGMVSSYSSARFAVPIQPPAQADVTTPRPSSAPPKGMFEPISFGTLRDIHIAIAVDENVL